MLVVRAAVRAGRLGPCQVEGPSIHVPQGRPLGQCCLPQGLLSPLSDRFIGWYSLGGELHISGAEEEGDFPVRPPDQDPLLSLPC